MRSANNRLPFSDIFFLTFLFRLFSAKPKLIKNYLKQILCHFSLNKFGNFSNKVLKHFKRHKTNILPQLVHIFWFENQLAFVWPLNWVHSYRTRSKCIPIYLDLCWLYPPSSPYGLLCCNLNRFYCITTAISYYFLASDTEFSWWLELHAW